MEDTDASGARRRRTATLAGVTVAATLVVVAAAGFVALRPAPERPTVAMDPVVTTQAGTPQLRLAAALAASGSTSYAFTTSTGVLRDGKVAKVAYLSPLLQGGPAPHVLAAVTAEFPDYGKTVTVQKPAAWVD